MAGLVGSSVRLLLPLPRMESELNRRLILLIVPIDEGEPVAEADRGSLEPASL